MNTALDFCLRNRLRLLSIFAALVAASLSVLVGEIDSLERKQEEIVQERSLLILEYRLTENIANFDMELEIQSKTEDISDQLKKIIQLSRLRTVLFCVLIFANFVIVIFLPTTSNEVQI